MTIPRPIVFAFLALPWLLAVATVAWIFVQRFPPNGTFVVESVMDGKSPYINPFLPSERVTVPGGQPEGWTGQRILGDPVYATARVPGPYQEAEMEIEFRSIRQPLIEFGIVRDAAGRDLELWPMYSTALQSDEWQAVPGGYVRRGTPASRLTSADALGLATWIASSSMPLEDDPPQAAEETDVSLRGAHDFYLIPSGGNIDITFSIQDVNRTRGASIVAIRVFRGNEEVKREVIETSSSRETEMGKVFDHRVRLADAGPGVYRVAFQTDDDVFIRMIKTTSRRWVVGPRIYFGDVVGHATSTMPGRAWTTSRHLLVDTFHREGLQTVTAGSDSAELARTHTPYRIDRKDTQVEPVRLEAPKGDVRIIGDGWFALRQDAFFEPKPKRMTDATEPLQEGIVGVITPYEKPESLGDDWYRARFRFAVDPSNDGLRFILSAPGVAFRAGAVDIGRVKITYKRDPLSFRQWIDLVETEARNAWRRL